MLSRDTGAARVSALMILTLRLNDSSSSGDEMPDQREDGENQQKVDEPHSHVESDKA